MSFIDAIKSVFSQYAGFSGRARRSEYWWFTLFNMIISMPKINKDLKRLQDKGYPITNILSIIQNDNLTDTIVYTSKEFQPCADTFSDRYSFVGPSIRKTSREVKKTKERLIYISLGTVNNMMTDFYKNCLTITILRDTIYYVKGGI